MVVVVHRTVLFLRVVHGEVMRKVVDEKSADWTPRCRGFGLDQPDTMDTEKVVGQARLVGTDDGTVRTPGKTILFKSEIVLNGKKLEKTFHRLFLHNKLKPFPSIAL